MEAEKKQLFDIETASTSGDGGSKEHLRQLGMSKLDAVLSKAQAGQDPWEYQQQPKRQRAGAGVFKTWWAPTPPFLNPGDSLFNLNCVQKGQMKT